MKTELKKEKSSKLPLILGGLVLVLLIGAFVVYKMNENARAYELEQQKKQQLQEERMALLEKQQEEEAKQAAEEAAAQESAEQTGFIGGIEYDTGLAEDSTEAEVIDVMHKMTHQKVRAEKKHGAIPMVEDTINQVYDLVLNSSFPNKEKMLEIADKWKNGWFDTIDSDHNFFWELQDGQIGKAYGVLSRDEEKTFIKNNFPEFVEE